MDINVFLKSVIEQDKEPVVICNTSDTIIYMNSAAVIRYAKRGGAVLIGRNLLECHNDNSRAVIKKITLGFEKGQGNDTVFTYHNPKENTDVYMVALRDENGRYIGYYEKHESRSAETEK